MVAYPVSYKLARWFQGILDVGNDFRVLCLGDSITAEGSSVTQLGLGIARTWRAPVYSGSFHRGAATGATGSSDAVFKDTPWSSTNHSGGTANSRVPGDVFADGSSKFNPNGASDNRISSNVGDGNTLYRCDFGGWSAGTMDLANYANGNPFTGECVARYMYHSKPTGNGTGSIKLTGRRNSAATGVAATLTLNTTEGLAYQDIVIAAGSTHPGVAVLAGTNDETGLHLHTIGAGGWASSGGVRTPGLYQSYMAVGSYTTADILALLGGGASPTCLDAYVKAFVQYAALLPNRFLHMYGQNATAAQATEFAGGGYALYKADTLAIVDRVDAVCAALGVSGHMHLLVGCYEGGTDAYNDLRSRALFEISQERDNCCLCTTHARLMPANAYPSTPYPWFLHTDGIHPLSTGAALLAHSIWCAGMTALDIQGYERSGSKFFRIGL